MQKFKIIFCVFACALQGVCAEEEGRERHQVNSYLASQSQEEAFSLDGISGGKVNSLSALIDDFEQQCARVVFERKQRIQKWCEELLASARVVVGGMTAEEMRFVPVAMAQGICGEDESRFFARNLGESFKNEQKGWLDCIEDEALRQKWRGYIDDIFAGCVVDLSAEMTQTLHLFVGTIRAKCLEFYSSELMVENTVLAAGKRCQEDVLAAHRVEGKRRPDKA